MTEAAGDDQKTQRDLNIWQSGTVEAQHYLMSFWLLSSLHENDVTGRN